ncbi:MAG: gliding motility protein GldB, partial [Tannerella sp.]|nr:gliding motility protein GldB [Tannerella sp.]
SRDDFNRLQTNYPLMLDILGKSLFEQTANVDTTQFYGMMLNYFSEPTLKAVYADALRIFADGSDTLKQVAAKLAHNVKRLGELFPDMRLPAVYMHVAGFRENILVADSIVSFSTDKYLGSDYYLYKNYFNSFRRRFMTPEHIASDCVKAWLRSEYPFTGNPDVLLDRMIYEGKIAYCQSLICRDATICSLMSLTDVEYQWCIDNEKALWTMIIERGHLYTPDKMTTEKYFMTCPSTFISPLAPHRIGEYAGFRIVEAYMKQTGATCLQLMQTTDSQTVLTKAKYKP